MKKSILFTLLVLPFMVLSGCDFENEDGSFGKFQDNLTFYQEINNKTPVINRVINATGKYSSAKMEMKEATFNSELTVSYDVTAYANEFVYVKVKEAAKDINNGITVEASETGEMGMFHDGLNNIITYSIFSQDSIFDIDNYDEDTIGEAIDDLYYQFASIAYSYLYTSNLYSNKAETEYTFAKSSEVEQYTPLAYGNGTFIQHYITKNQTIVRLNKDYSIKTVTYYAIKQSNVHPTTNQYLDEMMNLEEAALSISFNYGQRKENASLKNKFLGYLNNPLISGNPIVTLRYAEGDENGYSYYNQEESIVTGNVRMKGINDYVVKGTYTINFPMSTGADVRTNIVFITIEVPYLLHYYDDPMSATMAYNQLSLSSYESDVSKVIHHDGVPAILSNVESLTIQFEFEIKVNSDGELSISNEKYFAY